jgi:Protein of unknown function (DUF1329)
MNLLEPQEMNLRYSVLATAIASFLFAAAAHAQDISVIGADKSGNTAKTIPAWDGGLTALAAGSQAGGPYADPFASEQPVLIITAANADQYKANLAPGLLAMLKKYPTYKVNVYPTHRTAPLKKCVADETVANKGKAKLTAGGLGLSGTTGGVPFPQPKDGLEAMWNSSVRYRGDSYTAKWTQAAVSTDGKFNLSKFEVEYDFHFGACHRKPEDREANRMFFYIQKTTAPARVAGNILLVHETMDQSRDIRSVWNYNPGQRRVRLAPEVSYDNPGFAAEGLRTADDLTLFNGLPDRYDWKLLGKREVYLPYNANRATAATVNVDDLIKPSHLNTDLLRYELRRIWVVEGSLKSGSSHIYHNRTFYIDEDSWTILATDKYDASGKLWRYAEMHGVAAPDMGIIYPVMDVHYDLQSGRYLVSGIRTDEPKLAVAVKRSANDYSPQRLRGEGTR